MDGVAGYNQGYDVVHDPTQYRVIPPDILAKVHALQVDARRTNEQKTRLLKAGWEKGSVPTDITSKMDREKHIKRRKLDRYGKIASFPWTEGPRRGLGARQPRQGAGAAGEATQEKDVMAKVKLDTGMTVDALTLVKANLNDYMERSRRMIDKAEAKSEHRNDLIMLKNMIYFLSLDLKDIPTRRYKQQLSAGKTRRRM